MTPFEMLQLLQKLQQAMDAGVDIKSRYAHEIRAAIKRLEREIDSK